MTLLAAPIRYDTAAAGAQVETAALAAEAKTAQAAAMALTVGAGSSDPRAAIMADPRISRLSREAAQLIRMTTVLAAWHPEKDVDPALRASVDEALDRGLSLDELGDMVHSSLADAVSARIERATDEITPESRRSWSDTAGRTVSTRLTAEGVVSAAPIIEESAGIKLDKLWMTQVDQRVRSTHRHLQGKTAQLDKPFWRELGTDRQLRYPGDPEAPIDQTANCRCFMWLVPSDQSSAAEDTFHVEDDQFAMAAAGAPPGCGLLRGNAASLGEDGLDAVLDATYGLTAATERKYDEEKHKRDDSGRFSKKSGGGTQSQRDSQRLHEYKRWLANGGYDAIKRKYGLATKPEEKSSGGGSGKGGGKGTAKAGEDTGKDTGTSEVDRLSARLAQVKEEDRRRKAEIDARRDESLQARKLQRDREDIELIRRRDGEDAALKERERMVKSVERDLRDRQREIEQAQNFILAMRIRGELPEIVEAERQRLARLKTEAAGLVSQSRALGTTDEVRDLRDRVRSSRRVDDASRRLSRAQYDAQIKSRQRDADNARKAKQHELEQRIAEQRRQARLAEREAKRAARGRRASLVAGGSPQSCIIALLPEGDDEVTYKDGSTAPAHLTLAYLSPGGDGIEDEFDEIDAAVARYAASRHPFTVKVAGRATLGDDGDDVAIVEAEELAEAREWAEADECCGPRTLGNSTHPHWIPHLTGIDAEAGDEIVFDRIGAWMGDDKREYPLGGY